MRVDTCRYIRVDEDGVSTPPVISRKKIEPFAENLVVGDEVICDDGLAWKVAHRGWFVADLSTCVTVRLERTLPAIVTPQVPAPWSKHGANNGGGES